MLLSLPIASLLLVAGSVAASPYTPSALLRRENDTASRSNSSTPNVVRSTWDGTCFYPTADETFDLDEYLGKWYQVAGTLAEFTSGCTCITAEYSLNVSWSYDSGSWVWIDHQNNGTVRVSNKCQIRGQVIDIVGEAVTAPAAYGSKGVLNVQFATSSPEECPGPNYIVQGKSLFDFWCDLTE